MTRQPSRPAERRVHNPAPRPGPAKPKTFRFTDWAMI